MPLLDGIVGTDDVTPSTAGASAKFGQTDVGNNLAVTTMGFTLGGTAQGNYMLAQPSLFANITPALLTITMMGNPTKTYDGTTAVTLAAATFNIGGFIGGQGGTVAQSSATYATANAGTNINVTATLQPRILRRTAARRCPTTPSRRPSTRPGHDQSVAS